MFDMKLERPSTTTISTPTRPHWPVRDDMHKSETFLNNYDYNQETVSHYLKTRNKRNYTAPEENNDDTKKITIQWEKNETMHKNDKKNMWDISLNKGKVIGVARQ